MTPRYKHDCTACIFQGRSGEYDLYFCPASEGDWGGTVLARYGNDAPAYSSGPLSCYLTSDIPRTMDSAGYALQRLAKRMLGDGVVRLSLDREKVNELRETWAPFEEHPKETT
jgi:hypothetical protein